MKTRPAKSHDSYMDLICEFPLRPIRNKTDYTAATKVMRRLAVQDDGSLDAGASDYLDVLSDLIEAYDQSHHVLGDDTTTPTSRLKFLVESNKMTTVELAKLLGVSQPLASMMLSGQRAISRSSAKKLGERFRVNPGLFV